MLRVAVLLLATTALGARPTFQDVLKKFPASTLPITIKDLEKTSTKLNAADADALGFLKDASPQLSSLRAWKKKPGEGEKKSLAPIAAIQRTGYRLLLLRVDSEFPMGSGSETFLLSYSEQGALLGGLTFHLEFSTEAGGATNTSTLDQAGVISRLIKTSTPMHEAGLPEELVVTSEQRAKLTSAGSFEVMAPAWSTRTGAFLDHKSKEELRVFDKRVFYRGNDTKPFQELEGDGNTVRFKGSPRPYVLTWNDRRSAISCQNPDGKVQLFDREW
ncbi:MAG: hypothetical protein Q8L48_07905 [Archangium sp.]|nr:hypothetical protein [Archangium sp.]